MVGSSHTKMWSVKDKPVHKACLPLSMKMAKLRKHRKTLKGCKASAWHKVNFNSVHPLPSKHIYILESKLFLPNQLQ
jgi:hypothetical protein